MGNYPTAIHESWGPHLGPLFMDTRDRYNMTLLRDSVLPQCTFYPEKKDIFNVFRMPLTDIEVVVLGMDPYIKEGQATGYAFAVPQHKAIPPSLQVIRKEILREIPPTSADVAGDARWRTLEHWTSQGVFLLNTALTVEKGKSGSHMGYWSPFISEVIKVISREAKPIWLLWGRHAQGKLPYISNDNTVLQAPHPAAALYGRGQSFIGCGHFSITNQILEGRGDYPIHW
jgi:uracil-DNA glycosylase